MGHVPSGPDLPGAHGGMKLRQPPVGGDRRASMAYRLSSPMNSTADGSLDHDRNRALLQSSVTDDDGLTAAMPSSANGTIKARNSSSEA